MPLYPNIQLYILYSFKFGIQILTHCNLCQDTNSTQKVSIYVKNMLTKFLENQRPVKYFLDCYKHTVLIHQYVKYTMFIFQCKTYLNYDVVLITF